VIFKRPIYVFLHIEKAYKGKEAGGDAIESQTSSKSMQ